MENKLSKEIYILVKGESEVSRRNKKILPQIRYFSNKNRRSHMERKIQLTNK